MSHFLELARKLQRYLYRFTFVGLILYAIGSIAAQLNMISSSESAASQLDRVSAGFQIGVGRVTFVCQCRVEINADLGLSAELYAAAKLS